MNSYKVLKATFLIAVFCLIIQGNLIVKSYALTQSRNVQAVPNRYFEDTFEISVPGLPTKYDNVNINLDDVRVEIESNKIVIKGLVPDQVYNNVVISFNDDIGRKYELEFDNIITSQPSKADNKFVYDAYTNGLGRKPDHGGFKYWHSKLITHNITAVDFIMEMVSSDEFNSIYKNAREKINALYKTIVGREPEEEGLNFWMDQFNLLVDGMKFTSREAILDLVNRMIYEEEFKKLVDEAGFLYSK